MKYITDQKGLTKFLYEIFDALNYMLYGGELITPIIIVGVLSSSKKFRFANGVWHNGQIKKPEITVNGSFFLNKEKANVRELILELLKCMVYLYCDQHNIKCTSNKGLYHNSKYKKVAQDHGLKYIGGTKGQKYHGYIDYAIVSDSPVDNICSEFESKIYIGREKYVQSQYTQETRSNSIKWCCPICGSIIRSTNPKTDMYCACVKRFIPPKYWDEMEKCKVINVGRLQ